MYKILVFKLDARDTKYWGKLKQLQHQKLKKNIVIKKNAMKKESRK